MDRRQITKRLRKKNVRAGIEGSRLFSENLVQSTRQTRSLHPFMILSKESSLSFHIYSFPRPLNDWPVWTAGLKLFSHSFSTRWQCAYSSFSSFRSLTSSSWLKSIASLRRNKECIGINFLRCGYCNVFSAISLVERCTYDKPIDVDYHYSLNWANQIMIYAGTHRTGNSALLMIVIK